MAFSQSSDGILATILAEENFLPSEPRTLEETGLPLATIESLLCKQLSLVGMTSGRRLAEQACLPFKLLEGVFQSLRERQVMVHKGSAPFNDYTYTLTERGRERARIAMDACAYVGPAPVPLNEYVVAIEAQSIRAESPQRAELEDAFSAISVNKQMFDTLGPAINSGAGLFLYGSPGNGKSTLAKRITKCFGQRIWIPHTVVEDGQLIKIFDPSLHVAHEEDDSSAASNIGIDRRWICVSRPTVVVGGELTMEALEIRHDPLANISEAPLQLKANGGCFLIDDFGRQRIEPRELLNRWIVPLESRFDFLTLSTGKKIQVPFEQLIIFSTNLQPDELVDEAFLRRIPYKIEVDDPSPAEFHYLFEVYAKEFGCAYKPDVVNHLLKTHYLPYNRPLRRCHPRDLLNQIKNYCSYHNLQVEMRESYFDRVVGTYFAVVINQPGTDARSVAVPVPATPNQTMALPVAAQPSPMVGEIGAGPQGVPSAPEPVVAAPAQQHRVSQTQPVQACPVAAPLVGDVDVPHANLPTATPPPSM